MKIITIVSKNSLKQNTYIINHNNTNILIDCGASLDCLKKEYKKEMGKELKNIDAIFVTHTHFDHTWAIEEIINHYSPIVYVAKNCSSWISDPHYNASGMFARPLTYTPPTINEISTEDEIVVKNIIVKPYFTPGHTDCSMSYLINKFLFTGDTKFYLSVGRTDLPSGNIEKLKKSLEIISSIKAKLCYPGHGIPFKN